MWNPEDYTTTAHQLPRLLGFIYFWAIGAFLFQILGLLGKNGILPVKDYLDYFRVHETKKRYIYLPSLFWFNASDNALMIVTALGTCLSVLLMFGFYPSLLLALLFVIYLSMVSVGQDFLSFGWESLLLEITFYTFLVSLTPVPNAIAWFCLNFLLFRFFVQAGASKLQSHDHNWRNLSALWFHYQSQPLPNTWAWYVYKLPLSFHRFSTIFMFVMELAVPFGLFFTDEIRAWTGVALIGFQFIIWLTGNFSFLNHLSAVLSTIAFSNAVFAPLILPVTVTPAPLILDVFLTCIGSVFLGLQIVRFWNHFQRHQTLAAKWLYALAPFHLVNRYGLFAIMTTQRIEIVIEGSHDGVEWEEYLCKYKPSEITRRPRRISPYQPRLDWQMWFLPFDRFELENWFHRFLYHLLKGTPDVVKLVRYNPFTNNPPKYIRAVMYDYQFSSRKQKKELGWWWQRENLGLYSPVMSLKEYNNS